MKKHFKVLVGLLLIVFIAMLGVGCGGTEPAKEANQPADNAAPSTDKKLTIGFIPMTLNNEYFITMVNAAKQEAAKNGVELLVQAGEKHGSAEEQLQIVENMITRKVDAICIVPSSSAGLMTALKKAQDEGIPVINLDTRLDANLVKQSGLKAVPFFGTNNYDGAKLAGEYAVKLLNGKGKVAILTGIAGQQNAADRRNGFYDVVKGKLDVVAEQTANWEVEQGYNVTQNILQANPDISLIFASNDGMGIGAIRAVKEAGKNVKVVGFDAINEALNMVKSGEMAGTVAQYPAEMGIQGVKAGISLAKGETVPEDTNTGTKLIIKDNVEEFMQYLAQFK